LKARRGLTKWPVMNLKHDIKLKFKGKENQIQDASEIFNIYESYE
jgi:hypothetical protein